MIYLGADHGGFELKEKLRKWLTEWGVVYQDMGPYALDPEDDYPEFALAVAQTVANADNDSLPWKDRSKGILICRSAVGVTIAANKIHGARAFAGYDTKTTIHARINDDTNILCLSGDWLDEKQTQEIVKIWLETEFSHAERHERRINQIKDFERRAHD